MTSQEWKAEMQAKVDAEVAKRKANDKANLVRPNCHQCGKPLLRYSNRQQGENRQFGQYGDNIFCGLRCGYQFGLAEVKSRMNGGRK